MFRVLDYFAFYLITPVLVHTSKQKASTENYLKERFIYFNL
jgi:hypothetical protein